MRTPLTCARPAARLPPLNPRAAASTATVAACASPWPLRKPIPRFGREGGPRSACRGLWGLGPGRRLAGPARPRCQSGDYRTPSEMGESPEGGVRSMASGWDAVRQFARHGAIGHSRGVSLGAQREERGAQRGLGDRRPTYSRARRDTGASGAAFTWHRIGVQRNGQPKLWRRGDAFGCSLVRGHS